MSVKIRAGVIKVSDGNGNFTGISGVVGAPGEYYIPSVSDDGDISWTASASDMPSVDTVNIHGRDAEIDVTLTEAEKAADAKATGDRFSAVIDEVTAQEEAKAEYLYRLTNLEYAAKGYLYREEVDDAVAVTKIVPADAMQYARLDSVDGVCLLWNQIAPYIADERTESGVTITPNEDGSYTLNGKATSLVRIDFGNPGCIAGHKYLLRSCNAKANGSTAFGYLCLSNNGGGITAENAGGAGRIVSGGNWNQFGWRMQANVVYNNEVIWPQLFDLTAMFGEGFEPATVEEFTSLFPEVFYEYNSGEELRYMPVGMVSADSAGEEIETVDVSELPKYFTAFGGGRIWFANQDGTKFELPVKSQQTYLIKL